MVWAKECSYLDKSEQLLVRKGGGPTLIYNCFEIKDSFYQFNHHKYDPARNNVQARKFAVSTIGKETAGLENTYKVIPIVSAEQNG